MGTRLGAGAGAGTEPCFFLLLMLNLGLAGWWAGAGAAGDGGLETGWGLRGFKVNKDAQFLCISFLEG